VTTEEALRAIKSEDRNVRVRALRAVLSEAKPEGADVILAGLGDAKRRVREIALKSSKPYLGDRRIVERIAALIADEAQTQRIRRMAMMALGGALQQVNSAGEVPAPALSALKALASIERYRGAVLSRLVRMDLTPSVEALLKEYVHSGTKDEAVAATRALCGYRLVNWGSAKPAELAAAGAVHASGVDYWIRREYLEQVRQHADGAGPGWPWRPRPT
jgi:hypothetical protein